MSTYHQPGPAMPEQQPPAQAQRKRPRRWPWIVGIVVALGLGYGVGSTDDGTTTTAADSSPEPAPTVTVTATETIEPETKAKEKEQEQPPPEEETSDTISAGTWVVGTDIEPGQYRTDGPSDEIGCYWARLSGLSGEFDELIANGNPQGPATIEVAESDEALELSGTCDWEPVK